MKKAKRILDEGIFKLIASGSEENLNIAKEMCTGLYQDENYFWDALAIVFTELAGQSESQRPFIRINKSLNIHFAERYIVKHDSEGRRNQSYTINEAKDLVNEIRSIVAKLKKQSV